MSRESLVAVHGPFEFRRGDAAPFLTDAAARWALERLWALVGGGAGWEGPPVITFDGASRDDVSRWLEAPPGRWPRVPTQEGELPAPPGSGPAGVPFDLVTFLFLMLTRWEERIGARDGRDRAEAASSIAARQGFLDRPIIDEWAAVVRRQLQASTPRWAPVPQRFRLFLTHDIDVVRRFDSPRAILRSVAGRVRRGQLGGLAGDVGGWRDLTHDPYQRGLDRLMDASERHGLRSAFFFKTAARGPYDSGYRLSDPPGAAALWRVVARGHEVGFHPGYDTYLAPLVLAEERDRLVSALGRGVEGGRQHNLRFRAPDTWGHWDALGLKYDSSLGYAERAGFRCGTCHPYPVFDFVADRPLALVERPLIAMDTTLRSSTYEGLTAEGARTRALTLAERCRRVGGEFVLLWHNSSFSGQYEGWGDLYEPMVEELAMMAGGR